MPPWLRSFLPPTSHDWVIFIITVGVLIGFFCIGFRNRKIEKIAVRFWSAVAIGGVGVLIVYKVMVEAHTLSHALDGFYGQIMPAVLLYAVASMATIWASLNQETREEKFHSVFIYRMESKEPLEAVDRNYFSGRARLTHWDHLPAWLVHDNPSLSEAPKRLYLDVLLGMVLELLFTRYGSSWALDFGLINLPHLKGTHMYWEPQADAPAAAFVKWDKCKQWFPESGVFRAPVFGSVEQMAVPLETAIWGETQYNSQLPGWSLHLKNPFVEVTVSVVRRGQERGIGPLRKLIGLNVPHSEEFDKQIYAITLQAWFNHWRSGHPNMFWYRNWVDDMFQALQEELNSLRHWERQKEHYTVFRRE